MENVVVTGGAGFIGSHLAEELASRSYHVTILDDLSTGKLENIAHLLAASNVKFVRGSILDLSLLQTIIKDAKYVFHLAALSRVPQSIEDPLLANEINIRGMLNILVASRDNSVKEVIFSSSAAVYGEPDILPQEESAIPNPLSPYALTKLAGEHYCALFSKLYGLPTVCLRYFNVYGTRQDPLSPYSNVVPLFIGRAHRNLPPVIFGDGEQSRDFIFVNDVVRANIFAAEDTATGIYNIGSGEQTTINQLARIVLASLGKNFRPIYKKPRAGDPRHNLADIHRARSFGWEPQYSLEEGLKTIMPYYCSE